jgi:hypothetical protein
MRSPAVAVMVLVLSTAPTLSGTTVQPSPREPRPEPAMQAILDAFGTYRIVALGDYHGTRDLNDFVLSLLRHPGFPDAVDDIIVECTSTSVQPLLDRYIGGEDVPLNEARMLWRDQTHPPCSVEPLKVKLFQLVRRLNQTLPSARRLHVIGGEPPLDWRTLTPERHREFMEQRETHLAAVLEDRVVRKGRKALVFYGGAHLNHGVKEMAIGRFEEKHPGITFVIAPYVGASRIGEGCGLPAVVGGLSLDDRMHAWPVPSIARTRGTWLADFRRSEFTRPFPVLTPGVDPIDAYLYLGPPGLLMREPPSVFAFLDDDFIAELARRGTTMIGGNFRDARVEPDKVRDRELDSFVCRAG